MEKVKLTREQAEAIDGLHKTGRMADVRNHAHGVKWTNEKYLPLNELNLDEFIRAVYIGYVVDPDFKVGDWVACEYEDGTWIAQIEKFEGEKVFARWEFDRLDWNYIYDIRHATPEEIKAEQERRVWKKLNRGVREFRKGDVSVVYKGALTKDVALMDRAYADGQLKGIYPAESFIEFGGGEE